MDDNDYNDDEIDTEFNDNKQYSDDAKSIDIKNKGYITLDDLKDKTDLMPPEIFEMLDLDNDGKLTFEEFEQAFRETTNYDVQMENGNKHRELSIRNLN